MSTSQAVVQHLPFLRRYARALTGSQASGDAYVAATLESLITDPKTLESLPNQRVALYRLFTKIWNSVTLNGKADATTAPDLAPEQHITQITPRPRQAFLLVALEGFSEDEAAQILDVMLRLREPKGVYQSGGCIDSSREYPRWVCPGTADMVLPAA